MLSQEHNLYIVAFHDEIHVSRISFPDQVVQGSPEGANPTLKIRLARSRAGLRGYMPGTNAHAVNHVILGRIRDKEVVCVACDDGDVEAFYTNDIERAMFQAEAETNEGSSKGLEIDDASELSYHLPMDRDELESDCIRPFFHFNLGASAWGLAIQAEYAFLAVSTNAHKIFLFSFATAPPETGDEESHANDLWKLSSGNDLCGDRTFNRYAELNYHDANIPSITFEESSLPTLRNECPRLISADIGGTVVIWTLEYCRPVLVLKSHHEISDHDPLRAGWALLSLDPRAFGRADSLTAALGVCEVAAADQVYLVDISHSRQLISQNKRWSLADERRARTTTTTTATTISAATSDNEDDRVSPSPLMRDSTLSQFRPRL